MHVVAVIMAGGKGERLWPLSTPARPKQFVPLLNGRSLLQLAVERILPLVSKEQVLIVAPWEYAPLVQEQVKIPSDQILSEPTGKNTAPA